MTNDEKEGAITGAEAAGLILGRERVRVTLGRDCYHPGTGVIFLSEATYKGKDAGAVFRALHEAGHARQHSERPLWFALRDWRLFRIGIERDAWRRAEVWMRELGVSVEEALGDKERGLGSYKGCRMWGG